MSVEENILDSEITSNNEPIYTHKLRRLEQLCLFLFVVEFASYILRMFLKFDWSDAWSGFLMEVIHLAVLFRAVS